MEWTARAVRGELTFEPDEEAVVVNVVGVKLILDKLPQAEGQPVNESAEITADEPAAAPETGTTDPVE